MPGIPPGARNRTLTQSGEGLANVRYRLRGGPSAASASNPGRPTTSGSLPSSKKEVGRHLAYQERKLFRDVNANEGAISDIGHPVDKSKNCIHDTAGLAYL